MIEKIFNFFDKINVFNINTMWKSIFWIIWDITFAIFDFVSAKEWWVFGCGVAMCLFLICHFKIFLHFKREQDEKNRKTIPFSKIKDYLISLGYKIENDSDLVYAATMEQHKANEREIKERYKENGAN